MAAAVVDILVVEDDPSDEEFTRRALAKHHVTQRLQVVRDGEEALSFLFRTGPFEKIEQAVGPKCVFLDLKLPRVGGLEVLERLRSDPRTASLPVIVFTSSRESSDVAEAYRLGANSYVVKPVAFADYERVIAEVGRYWLGLNQPAG